MSKPVELKPCPFCGGKPRLIDLGIRGYAVGCDNIKCNLFVETYKYDRRCDAVRVWNHRAKIQNSKE